MADRVLLASTHHPPWTERVANTVIEIEGTDAEVLLLHVFTEEERKEAIANLDLEGEVELDQLARRKDDVSDGMDVLEDAGVPFTVRGIEHDDQAEAILTVADEEAVDRIYVFSRRRSPAGKAIFGSAVQAVILRSSIPVVVTPHRASA